MRNQTISEITGMLRNVTDFAVLTKPECDTVLSALSAVVLQEIDAFKTLLEEVSRKGAMATARFHKASAATLARALVSSTAGLPTLSKFVSNFAEIAAADTTWGEFFVWPDAAKKAVEELGSIELRRYVVNESVRIREHKPEHKPGTVGALKELIAHWPNEYLISLACDEMDADDVVFTGEIGEGNTSDGPGHVMLRAVELNPRDDTVARDKMYYDMALNAVMYNVFEVEKTKYREDGLVVMTIRKSELASIVKGVPNVEQHTLVKAFQEGRVVRVVANGDATMSIEFRQAADDHDRRVPASPGLLDKELAHVDAHAVPGPTSCNTEYGCLNAMENTGRPCNHGQCQREEQKLYDAAMKAVAHNAFEAVSVAGMTDGKLSVEIRDSTIPRPGTMSHALNRAFEQKRVHSVKANDSGTLTIVYEQETADDRVRQDWQEPSL